MKTNTLAPFEKRPQMFPTPPLDGIATEVGCGETVFAFERIATRNGLGSTARLKLALATGEDRETIYRLRHDVYGKELVQHPTNGDGRLRDSLDEGNIYLVASVGEELVGFISVTPPTSQTYSIDKYLSREEPPFPFDDGLYEVRLLTVIKPSRGRQIAALLMYAAFRWVEAHGGARIMAIGREEILDLYLKAGLQPIGIAVRSGAVTYQVLQSPVASLRQRAGLFAGLFDRIERETDWRLAIPFQKPASCFHGGAFFSAIGEEFETLEKRQTIINADVLDAWFPPSPKVISALQDNLPWLLQTSPPTGCEGLIKTIARVRGVNADCVLAGAGSSDLIFLAFRQWLSRDSRVLLLDPTYGEYAHVLGKVVRCQVDRLTLSRRDGYRFDPRRLEEYFEYDYDLIVLVNPNSPTGRHVAREELEGVLRRVPANLRVWLDETYVEYAGADQSLERFSAQSENVIVCKSMSKVYALSGVRAAYLCAGPQQLEQLRAITPPWAVSLPAQLAAVRALEDSPYYSGRYEETHRLRSQLVEQLCGLNLEIVPGVANFVLCHLPADGPHASTVVAHCRDQNLFLRDASNMGLQLGKHALRLAVKDAEKNTQMVEILKRVLRD
ncbi:MAG: aminotransferase class I/II-fold pyridoxal phosphate-dependent enzyme [Verrucomicrobia bacterium]|nr:aminotransferase class I/II-fold pyridoxal phosphate-dependent enzyme [Verrucomicrobiota bacterium]